MHSVLEYGDAWDVDYEESRSSIRNATLVLLGPLSHLGKVFGPMIAERCPNVIAAVDDQSSDKYIHGIPRWTTTDLRAQAQSLRGLACVDLTWSPYAHAVLGNMVRECGFVYVDLLRLITELDLVAVYQTPREMRVRTIARQAEWQAFRDSLVDEASRATLDAILLSRLKYDRRYLRSVTVSLEDEYFGVYAGASTFCLNESEVFADCGAFIGSTVRKVIAATGGRFRAIHAFEPDRGSFSELEKIQALGIPGIELHNVAVGEAQGTVQFLETGTMGSRVDESRLSGRDTPVVRLDDVMQTATFIKMDLEGYEQHGLRGASQLIRQCRPRMAITAYHYADDLLDLWRLFEDLAPDYELRLRHHSSFCYDTIFYLAPKCQ